MSGENPTTKGRSVTISLPTLSGLRSGVRVPRLPVGRLGRGRWRIALVVAILLIGVFDLLLVRQGAQQDARSVARAEALRSAEARMPSMLSYSYQTLDADLAVAAGNATGPFRDEYAQVLSTVVAPNAAQKKISTTAEVAGASVISGGDDRVTLLVFITQSTTTGEGVAPVSSGSRIQVTMVDTDDGWFVAGIKPV